MSSSLDISFWMPDGTRFDLGPDTPYARIILKDCLKSYGWNYAGKFLAEDEEIEYLTTQRQRGMFALWCMIDIEDAGRNRIIWNAFYFEDPIDAVEFRLRFG
jgi:hypothetical protein